MKNEKKKIIYVGKAVNLNNRVRQYFRSKKNMAPKVRAMVSHIDDFEYIITDSEMEALILENNLIKEHKPPYNILLRDDKTYPFIKITLGEYYPRVIKTRRVVNDGSKYYGPYSNPFIVNDILEMVHKVYKIRSCKRDIKKSQEKRLRPCLDYYIDRCTAPCIKKISEEDYMEQIKEIMSFLEAKDDTLIKMLEEDMKEASKNMEYEKAAEIRDKIEGINLMLEKQKIVNVSSDDQDFISVENVKDIFCVQVFFVRGGKIIGRENFIFDDEMDPTRENVLASFVKQFYSKSNFIPKEIYANEDFHEREITSQWLTNVKGSKVEILVPKIGQKKKLLNMVSKNALDTINLKRAKETAKKEKYESIEKELKEVLGIEGDIHKIESYDISNIQGVDSVGGQVVFVDGKRETSLYRRYKVRDIVTPDDYASMEHIIHRRLKHEDYPDLILLDGGKGHVSRIRQLLFREGVDVPVFGMYKDKNHKTVGLTTDKDIIPIKKHSPLYRFLSRVQEEVHRFAISYHKTLRDKKVEKSVLDNIPTIGNKRKINLLKEFKTIDNIKKATVEELKEVEGMNKRAAENVYGYFRGE